MYYSDSKQQCFECSVIGVDKDGGVKIKLNHGPERTIPLDKLTTHLTVQMPVCKGRLGENMRQLGFALCTTDGGKKGVGGDGNCQFYSLSWMLHNTTRKAAEVRASIVEHLDGPGGAQAKASYAPEHRRQPRTWRAYLSNMAHDTTWGDHYTLQAAADKFQIRIKVLTSQDYKASADAGSETGWAFGCVQIIVPARGKANMDIWVGFAAQHYSPIVPTAFTPKELLSC